MSMDRETFCRESPRRLPVSNCYRGELAHSRKRVLCLSGVLKSLAGSADILEASLSRIQ